MSAADKENGRRLTVDELIEKLRSVKWEVIDDDDWDSRCVFVDMRPDDFEALLNEAAAALEAARAERGALRNALSRILENEASDWKAAEEFGGYVLDDELREEARAALRAMGYEVPARD